MPEKTPVKASIEPYFNATISNGIVSIDSQRVDDINLILSHYKVKRSNIETKITTVKFEDLSVMEKAIESLQKKGEAIINSPGKIDIQIFNEKHTSDHFYYGPVDIISCELQVRNNQLEPVSLKLNQDQFLFLNQPHQSQ